MIDSHIHLLPSIDDGAANIDIAHEMVKVASEDGIQATICTPHDLNGIYQNNRNKILSSLNELNQSFQSQDIPIDFYPGAELHMDPDLVSKVLEGDAMSLADKGKHVLVEFPKMFLTKHAESILENLLFNKITPIIAHPERNPVLVKNQPIFSEWISWGCKAQITAMSITGHFGKPIQSTSKNWCQRGLIHLIASDAHRPTGRAPKLASAYQFITDWMGEDSAELLFLTNPQRIIDGNEILKASLELTLQDEGTQKRRWFEVLLPKKSKIIYEFIGNS